MAVLVLLVPLVGWAVQGAAAQGGVLPRVTLQGDAVGGASREELRASVAEVAAGFAATPVEIRTGERVVTTTAGELGVSIDQEATVQRVLDTGRQGFFLRRFASWVGSLFGDRAVTVALKIDQATVERTVAALDADPALAPVEPSFVVAEGGALQAVAGRAGTRMEAADVLEALRTVRFTTDVIAIEVPATEVPPRFRLEDAEALVAEAERMTADGLEVTAGRASTDVAPEQLRSWLTGSTGPDGFTLGIDSARVAADLAPLLAAGNVEPQPGSITVEDRRPVIDPGTPGQRCCAPEAGEVIFAALKAGTGGPVAVPMVEVRSEDGGTALEQLGITELVGEFTTRHKCCEPRVTNIHLVADKLRGTIIKPGATLSLNETLGRRTAANGFVDAPAIVDGKLEPQVGGGISQFMTTIFNAAFFAGLEFGEYQSHSLFIPRYPFGREATLSWPAPDLEIRNTSPHGVLVWTRYTSTSITVELYSTKVWSKVEQTALTTTLAGKSCTAVRVERTRTRPDGTTVVDAVRARYRAQEGLNCDQPLPPGVKPQAAPGQPPPSFGPESTTPGSSTSVATPSTTTPATTGTATTAPASTTAPTTTAPTTVPPTTTAPTTTVPPTTTSTTTAAAPPAG